MRRQCEETRIPNQVFVLRFAFLSYDRDDPYFSQVNEPILKAAVGRFVSLSYVPLRSTLVQK